MLKFLKNHILFMDFKCALISMIVYGFYWVLTENITNWKWIEKNIVCVYFKDCHVYRSKIYQEYINHIAKHDSTVAMVFVIILYLIFGYNFLRNFYHEVTPKPSNPVFDRNTKANNCIANNNNTIFVQSCIQDDVIFPAPPELLPKTQIRKKPLIAHVHPQRKNEPRLTKKLLKILTNLRKKADDESKTILATNAYFSDSEELILYCENLKSDNITKFQTKVKLTSNIRKNSVICTIVDYDVKNINQLKLKLRQGSHFKARQKETDKFTVTLYPNFEEVEFKEDAYRKICANRDMLKKIWAYDMDFENPNRLTTYCLSEFELYGKIESATKIGPLLICAKRKCDIEKFAKNLEKNIPTMFQRHLVAYIVTFYRPKLPEYTIILDDSTNLQNFKIILCTIGVVPKVIKRCCLAKNYFKEIFIVEAQEASELDCWMVIGHAANIDTKISICGTMKRNRRSSSYSSYHQHETNTIIDNDSMFNRLCKKDAEVNHSLNWNAITVFEL